MNSPVFKNKIHRSVYLCYGMSSIDNRVIQVRRDQHFLGPVRLAIPQEVQAPDIESLSRHFVHPRLAFNLIVES